MVYCCVAFYSATNISIYSGILLCKKKITLPEGSDILDFIILITDKFSCIRYFLAVPGIFPMIIISIWHILSHDNFQQRCWYISDLWVLLPKGWNRISKHIARNGQSLTRDLSVVEKLKIQSYFMSKRLLIIVTAY